jgi:hypothetical protein
VPHPYEFAAADREFSPSARNFAGAASGTAVDFEVRMAKPKKRQDDGNSPEYSSPPSGEQNGNGNGSGNDNERISSRAYELYLARGGSDGQAWDDWLAAERELSSPPGHSDE